MLLGYILAFLSSLLFAASDVMIRAASRSITPRENMLVTLLVGSPILYLISIALGEKTPPIEGLLVYSAIGMLNFYLGRLLFYTAIAGLGAASSAIMTAPVPVTAGLLANLALGEELSLRHIAGLTAVSIAVYLAAARPSGRPLGGVGRRAALAAGLSVIAIFTVSTVAVRWASQSYGSPILGVFASYLGALSLATIHIAAAGGGDNLRIANLKPDLMFTASGGLLVALAQASRYSALSLIPVADAISLISLFPINTVIIASLIPSLGERIKLHHMLAAIVAIAGLTLVLRD